MGALTWEDQQGLGSFLIGVCCFVEIEREKGIRKGRESLKSSHGTIAQFTFWLEGKGDARREAKRGGRGKEERKESKRLVLIGPGKPGSGRIVREKGRRESLWDWEGERELKQLPREAEAGGKRRKGEEGKKKGGPHEPKSRRTKVRSRATSFYPALTDRLTILEDINDINRRYPDGV